MTITKAKALYRKAKHILIAVTEGRSVKRNGDGTWAIGPLPKYKG